MAKHPIEESDEDIVISTREMESIQSLSLSSPGVDKLLRYYLLRDKDVGKQLYDAVVSRVDKLSATINAGKLGKDNAEVDALIDLMSKSQGIIKGMIALKEFSTLGIKKEEPKKVKSMLDLAAEYNKNRTDNASPE